MRLSVLEVALQFTERFEGGVSCAYNDVRGLTTIAFGNLVNTPSEFAALPLVHPDGTFATTSEKIAAWYTVHDDPLCASRGWRYAAKLTPLRLTREGMTHMFLNKLNANDRVLLARLPDWEDLNACAQLAMHSLAWACGANAHFPRLFEDVRRREFSLAAVEIHMNEWTPEGIHNAGLVPRNAANRILMLNAQRVQDYGLDPDTINWESIIGVSDEVTQPELPNPPSDPIPCVNTDIIETSHATYPTVHADPGTYLRPDSEPKFDVDSLDEPDDEPA